MLIKPALQEHLYVDAISIPERAELRFLNGRSMQLRAGQFIEEGPWIYLKAQKSQMSRVPSAAWIICYDLEKNTEPDLSYPEIKNSGIVIQCQADGSFPQYYLYVEFFHKIEPCFLNLPRYGIPDSAIARQFYLHGKQAQRHFYNHGALLDGPHYPRVDFGLPLPRVLSKFTQLTYMQSAVFPTLFRFLLYDYACTKGLRKALIHCPDCKHLRLIKMFITHRECLECVKVSRVVIQAEQSEGDHYHFHCFNCDCQFYVNTEGEQHRCNYYGIDSAYQYAEE